MPRFLHFLREFWPMPLPLMIHSALVLFAQRTLIPTSARSIGFCVIWVCISSSSSTGCNSGHTITGPIIAAPCYLSFLESNRMLAVLDGYMKEAREAFLPEYRISNTFLEVI